MENLIFMTLCLFLYYFCDILSKSLFLFLKIFIYERIVVLLYCEIKNGIIMAKISKRKTLYLENKSKKVGETCTCPICGDTFVKRQWQQAFDSKYCKEKYWNDKPDRHRSGYYAEYNEKHPERLLRIGIDLEDDTREPWLHPCCEDAVQGMF